MSPRPISKAAAANLARHGYSRDHRRDRPQMVIGLLCAARAARSRSRCSRATPPTRRRWPAQIDKLKERFDLEARRHGRRPRHDHRRADQRGRSARPGSTGSPPCAHRRSRNWPPMTARCNSRCSTIATWPRSPVPIFPASGWSSAAIRCWPRSAPASARNCWPRPRRTWPHQGRAVRNAQPVARRGRDRPRRRCRARSAQDGQALRPRPSPTTRFSFTATTAAIAAEAALDGIYVIRTNLPAAQSDAAATVRAYKSLAQVERAFRCMKTVDLELRPVFHWTAPRVRAHVLLCMLAYYLEWHMRRRLAPMLFDEHDPAGGARRSAPRRSPRPLRRRQAQGQDQTHRRRLPLHSFRRC